MKKRLPVGIDDFGEIISGNYYYADKTELVKMVIESAGQVKLFTRPRRFGKTLNMSMLKSFFEIGQDPALFDGLSVSKDQEFCSLYQGKYPVIFISLKGVNGLTYEDAEDALRTVIGREAERFSFLLDSNKLTELEIQRYERLIEADATKKGVYSMPTEFLSQSLVMLTDLLEKHFHQKVVVLIDEYDVPLDKAHINGFYDQMVTLIRNMFQAVFKTNENLAFGVITGCLRISKESIFTGFNNLRVESISGPIGSSYYGFTEEEVQKLLTYYDLSDKFDEVKKWYDGYKFYKTDMYCPWDVLNYCADHQAVSDYYPQNYWINSSGNDLVREFIDYADAETLSQLERLIAGGKIEKAIDENITYRDIDSSIDNLWSVLYSTGYLTGTMENAEKLYSLWIPNLEVHDIFVTQIEKWFKQKVRKDTKAQDSFYHAILKGDPETMERVLTNMLQQSISIRDTYVRKERKENFYHGFVLGLLSVYPEVTSNPESGNGYSDIIVRNGDTKTGAVLELKYSETDDLQVMEKDCQEAMNQIDRQNYVAGLQRTGVKTIFKYGISFNRKISCVRMDE
ncbi:MAG: AAA family ATPase [Oribacterium sp.]|nr:AAA family ATPase [Oribacterium sp.]